MVQPDPVVPRFPRSFICYQSSHLLSKSVYLRSPKSRRQLVYVHTMLAQGQIIQVRVHWKRSLQTVRWEPLVTRIHWGSRFSLLPKLEGTTTAGVLSQTHGHPPAP